MSPTYRFDPSLKESVDSSTAIISLKVCPLVYCLRMDAIINPIKIDKGNIIEFFL